MSVQLNPTSSRGLAQIIEASQSVNERAEDAIQTAIDRKRLLFLGGLALLGICAFLLSLSWSSVHIPVGQVLAVLMGGAVEKETWRTIVMDIRLPRVITATAVGIGMGLSGLQMQTLFRNPLASPFTLGVSSGASLGVALIVIALPVTVGYGAIGGGLLGNLGTVAGAALGAFAVLVIMLAVAARVQEMTTVLLLGVVIGALVGH